VEDQKNIIISSAPTANISFGGTSSPVSNTIKVEPVTLPTAPTYRPLILTILFSLLTGVFIYRTVMSLLVIYYIVEKARPQHLILRLFNRDPFLCLIPVFLSIFTVYLIFIFLKTRIYSAGSRQLVIISSIIIPLIYSLISRNFFQEINLLFLLILIFCLLTDKLATHFSSPLTDQQVALFTVLTAIILFPITGYTYAIISVSTSPDTLAVKYQNLVGHRLLEPYFLPQNLIPATTFYVEDKKDAFLLNPTAKIVYGNEQVKPSLNVVISQTQVDKEFDLLEYVKLQINGGFPESVPVSTSTSEYAYFYSSPTGVNSLFFLTPDYVLITIVSPNYQIDKGTLIDLAQSLR